MMWRLRRLHWRLKLVWDILWSPWEDIKDFRYDNAVGQARRLAEGIRRPAP